MFTDPSMALASVGQDSANSTSNTTTSSNEELQELELIVGLRGVPYLVYLNVNTMQQRSVSLNENEWDNHVSFTPLYLSLSPDGKYVLVATDKNIHIVLQVGSNRRVRTLSGHGCGDYGKPIAVWDYTGQYIYCNSEEEHVLYVYSIAAQRVEQRIKGHSGIIRGVATHPKKALVATASYDKSVGVWVYEG